MVAHLLGYILSSMGATILIVWPVDGPGAWIRDRLLRPTLPGKAKAALDCYICLGFWCGLGISLPWWLWYREPWVWLGCLMVPTVFWLVLGQGRA